MAGLVPLWQSLAANLRSAWIFDDPTVSAMHLRLYTVCYDEEGTCEPIVFAEDLSSNGTFWNDRYMGRGQGAVVLSDGDKLKLNHRIMLLWRSGNDERPAPVFSEDHQREIETFRSEFIVSTKLLGSGSFGKVFVATNVVTKKQVACKMVDCAGFRQQTVSASDEAMILGQGRGLSRDAANPGTPNESVHYSIAKRYNEVDILQNLRHPNIVRIEKVYDTAKTMYIMQELLTGGDLFSYCIDLGHDGRLQEPVAGLIVKQVLEAVKYLHDHGIVHRDIKPENVLLDSRGDTPRVVLADFGEARQITPTSDNSLRRAISLAGTSEYMAPEVWDSSRFQQRRAYTTAVDLWSVGMLTFSIVAGFSPFDYDFLSNPRSSGKPTPGEIEKACRIMWASAERAGANLSSRLRDFVSKLLVVDESRRMSAETSLDHHWFRNNSNRAAFDAVYERAIQSCQPTPPATDVMPEMSHARSVLR